MPIKESLKNYNGKPKKISPEPIIYPMAGNSGNIEGDLRLQDNKVFYFGSRWRFITMNGGENLALQKLINGAWETEQLYG